MVWGCGGALSTAAEPETSSTIIAKVEGKRESKNRPVATNFQFLKISSPLGQLSCWGVRSPKPCFIISIMTDQRLIYSNCQSLQVH